LNKSSSKNQAVYEIMCEKYGKAVQYGEWSVHAG